MAQLYLVAFKERSSGNEDDINYALREVIEEHCSYCLPAGKTEVFGPRTPKNKIAEICWLMQEVGFQESDYWDLIDELRSRHKKRHGHQPQSWYKYFYSGEGRKAVRDQEEDRRSRWKEEKNYIFRRLIKSWIPLPKKR